MRLGIMGPQGSGKSTQSKLLGEKLSLCVVDTGQLIRDRGNLDDSVGKSIQAAMLSGNLVENQIPAEILENRLGELDCQNGFVVDGYPRSLEQLEDFDPKYERVFYLDISDDIAVERLSKRGREDDTPEGIKQRLLIFHQKTKDVLDYYDKLGILVRIDGDKSQDQVSKQIEESLNV